MTLKDWDIDVAAMKTAEIRRYRKALAELKKWESLHKEFKWTGLWVLETTLEYEEKGRTVCTVCNKNQAIANPEECRGEHDDYFHEPMKHIWVTSK